jgi:hypothetical protein
MPPAHQGAELMDEDAAEAALIDNVGSRPDLSTQTVDCAEQPARRPFVVAQKKTHICDLHDVRTLSGC